jgi:hypothetical protein
LRISIAIVGCVKVNWHGYPVFPLLVNMVSGLRVLL